MQVEVSFRHMEPSEPLKDYAAEKVNRVVRKYIRGNVDAQVTLSVEKFRHIANLLVNYKGLSIKSEESSEDMYSSIDLALDKLERQVRRYKTKLKKHKPSQNRERFFGLSVLQATQEDFEDDDDLIDTAAEEEAIAQAPEDPEPDAKATPEVIKREVMNASEMEVEHAIMTLDLEEKQFLVFTNTATNSINVLYRRGDGTFGLIEPH